MKPLESGVTELRQQHAAMAERLSELEGVQAILGIQLELANALNDAGTLAEGLSLCLDAAIAVSGLDCGGIYLFDDHLQNLELVVHKNLSEEFVAATSVYAPDTENAKLVLKGEPFYVNYQQWEEPLDNIAHDRGLHAVAAIPLRHRDRILGCLNVASYTLDIIPQGARMSLETIALQLGSAVSRLKTEKILRDNEERFRMHIENAVDGMTLTENGRYTYVNDAYLDIFGYDRPDDIVGKDMGITVHPDDRKRVRFIHNQRVQGKGVPERYAFKGIKKNGQAIQVEVTARSVYHQGRIMVLGTFRDITEKLESQEKLKKSEKKFRDFFQSIPIAAALSSKHLEPLQVNQAFEDLTGYSIAEINAMKPREAGVLLSHPEDFQKEMQLIDKLVAGEITDYNIEKRFFKKNGEMLYAEVSNSMIFSDSGERELSIYWMQDVTKRKTAEKKLKEVNERYAALFDRSFDGVYIHDFAGNYMDCNQAVMDLSGYSKADLINLNIADLLSEDDLAAAGASIHIIRRQGYDPNIRHYRIRTKHNEFRDLETRAALIYRDGEPFAIQGIARDITEQKNAEKSLMESETKFRKLFESSAQPVALSRLEDGTYIDVNQRFSEHTGYTREEIVGKTSTELGFYSAADRRRVVDELLKHGLIKGLEVDFRVKGGETINTLLSCTSIKIKGESCILSTYVDMTNLKRLEARVRQSQKLEAVGTLAGGIAHDFNNILGIILGNAELAELRMDEEESEGYNVKNVIDACLRGKQVIRQLLDFSRQGRHEKFTLMLTPLIKEALKLIRPFIPATIDIRQSYADDNVKTRVDPGQMHQVIMNLCTNAYQAMPDTGGLIEVFHDTVAVDEKNKHAYENLTPGRYVRLRVTDTGEGIPPEHLDRVFDPYFTTKEGDAGTGLGLAVVYGIVSEYRGHISVSSEPGRGTTFTILLPAAEEEAAAEPDVERAPFPKGNERVLFVDDEEELRTICGAMLEKLGYEATVAPDALQGLELFHAAPRRFDLIITDMAMPGMSGAVFAGEVFKSRPDMPMILCTGHHDHYDEEKSKEMGFKAFLMKPIKMNVLADKVRNVLDQSK